MQRNVAFRIQQFEGKKSKLKKYISRWWKLDVKLISIELAEVVWL